MLACLIVKKEEVKVGIKCDDVYNFRESLAKYLVRKNVSLTKISKERKELQLNARIVGVIGGYMHLARWMGLCLKLRRKEASTRAIGY